MLDTMFSEDDVIFKKELNSLVLLIFFLKMIYYVISFLSNNDYINSNFDKIYSLVAIDK